MLTVDVKWVPSETPCYLPCNEESKMSNENLSLIKRGALSFSSITLR